MFELVLSFEAEFEEIDIFRHSETGEVCVEIWDDDGSQLDSRTFWDWTKAVRWGMDTCEKMQLV